MPDEPHLPDLDAVRMLLTAVDRGSIQGAAQQLGTSRARVRRRLEHLEEALGLSLLRRTRDGVELTPDGQRFLERARPLLADARRLFLQVQQEARRETTMRIGLQVGYPPAMAVQIALAVAAKVPGSRTEYHVAERPTDLLPDRVDIVVCIGEARPPVDCEELTVGRLRAQLYGSVEWIERHGRPERAEDAVPHVVGMWRGDGQGAHLPLVGGGHLSVNPSFSSPDEVFLAHLAATGRGLVYAPLPPAGIPPLEVVLPEVIGHDVRARLLVPKELMSVPRVATLLETARAAMAERR